MSKARGVTMPRAIVPYICKLATATTSPRARFVLMHGQVWKRLGQRPAGMRLGRAKDCYKNATNAVLDCPAWRYVEGYAHHRLGIIAEHAWAVDEQGRVIETTWPDAGTAYVGVAFDEAALRRAICATPCFCLLCWQALPRIAPDYARGYVSKK
jgi:hypothetical protein